MRNRTVRIAAAATTLFVVVALTGCGAAASGPSPSETTSAALDGQTVMQEKCVACHTLQRIESARKTPTEWEDVVGRMEANGLAITAEEKAAVLEYLSATYK